MSNDLYAVCKHKKYWTWLCRAVYAEWLNDFSDEQRIQLKTVGLPGRSLREILSKKSGFSEVNTGRVNLIWFLQRLPIDAVIVIQDDHDQGADPDQWLDYCKELQG